MGTLISDKYAAWERECDERFRTLKANEEELNSIFIDIYGLQDELTPEVEDRDVTVRRADLSREIRSLISYAVGCMFGRYSLDVEGLVYAGGEFSDQWVVVSGQYYARKVVEFCVGKELSRACGMAEVDGTGGIGLSAGEAASKRGVVFTFGPAAQGCGFDSVQYRRGTSKKLYEGIQKLSVDCEGIERGSGNPAYDLCSPEILNAITSGSGAELVQRGWKDAERIDWKALNSSLTTDRPSLATDHYSLSTNHPSLATDHYSLATNHFCPDKDGILPICDDEYFSDDIVGRFVEFIRVVYGGDTLEENLRFIAGVLGGSGMPREVIRKYFINDFYADHCKVYQKRPIYWLFDSGKKNGFKCLIYMHRYKPDTIARIRTDYVHEQQSRYRTAIADLERRMNTAPTAERVRLGKQLAKLQDQANELREYEEKIHHLADQMIRIDLDDGVRHNYEIFKDVLAKIK